MSRMWMWNPSQTTPEDEEDSWEVRAFAEDTNHAMGTTWPPRSYTCSFCKREFRSAQALGGHMNVHRRDRARLHQAQPCPDSIPADQELGTNGGLCLLYSLPNPNGVFTTTTINAGSVSVPSTLLSIFPYPLNYYSVSPCVKSNNFPATSPNFNNSLCHSSNLEPGSSIDSDNNQNTTSGSAVEELDLELRLGPSSWQS